MMVAIIFKWLRYNDYALFTRIKLNVITEWREAKQRHAVSEIDPAIIGRIRCSPTDV